MAALCSPQNSQVLEVKTKEVWVQGCSSQLDTLDRPVAEPGPPLYPLCNLTIVNLLPNHTGELLNLSLDAINLTPRSVIVKFSLFWHFYCIYQNYQSIMD